VLFVFHLNRVRIISKNTREVVSLFPNNRYYCPTPNKIIEKRRFYFVIFVTANFGCVNEFCVD